MSLGAPWEPNPVFSREARGRWRGRAFIVIFGYVAVLAVVILSIYATSASRHDNLYPLRHMAELGHNLFLYLSWMQMVGWLMLAPALTATSIASEREHGLLEILQVSPLTPWRIVWGKLCAALLFVGLVLLATMPLGSLCFLLGGVSPGEFAGAALLQVATAVTSASIGLFCSAWTRRASSAMTFTWIFMLLWIIGSFSAIIVRDELGFQMFARTNPVLAVLLLLQPTPFRGGLVALGGPSIPEWTISLIFQAVLTPILLFWTGCGVRQPLAAPYWMETPTGASISLASTAPDATAAISKARWDLPLIHSIRFANPLLQREVRSKFRLRRLPLWNWLIIAGVASVLGYWYLQAILEVVIHPAERHAYWKTTTNLGLVILMMAAALMGANAFTGERQAGTWQALALSRLTSTQIITAKVLAPLLACLVYSIPAWPLLGCCLLPGDGQTEGIVMPQAFLTGCIATTSAWLCAAWGMGVSWHCTRTATASGWTLGGLMGALVFLPGLLVQLTPWGAIGMMNNFYCLWHPFIALDDWADGNRLIYIIVCPIVQFTIGCILLLNLRGAMRYRGRERDATG